MKGGKYLRRTEKKSDRNFYLLLIAGVLVFLLLFQPVRVQGSSMETTLLDGDLFLMTRDWLVKEYRQGDIIVASKANYKDGACIVKRVIALEGQVVDIDNETGTVYVDNVALQEPYLSGPTYAQGDTVFPLIVAENCVFVLGDHRGASLDSRYTTIGQIHTGEIQGKLACLLFPGTDDGEFSFDITRIGTVD